MVISVLFFLLAQYAHRLSRQLLDAQWVQGPRCFLPLLMYSCFRKACSALPSLQSSPFEISIPVGAWLGLLLPLFPIQTLGTHFFGNLLLVRTAAHSSSTLQLVTYLVGATPQPSWRQRPAAADAQGLASDPMQTTRTCSKQA